MPVTSSASWGAQVIAKIFTSEGVLGIAGCAMACASGAFALYMNMQPASNGSGSHDFTVFAQMTPRARAERAARLDAAHPVTTVGDEIDPIVTGSIPARLSESTASAGRRRQTTDPATASDTTVLTNVVLRQIDGDSALVEMQDNLVVYKIGQTIPGAGRLIAMTRQDGRPALQTSRGLIVEAQ